MTFDEESRRKLQQAAKRYAFDLHNAALIARGQSITIVSVTPQRAEAARQRALGILDEWDRRRA